MLWTLTPVTTPTRTAVCEWVAFHRRSSTSQRRKTCRHVSVNVPPLKFDVVSPSHSVFVHSLQTRLSRLPRPCSHHDITVTSQVWRYIHPYFPCFCSKLTPRVLKAPYTDPKTGLRYHDKSVYELIKGLVSRLLDHI